MDIRRTVHEIVQRHAGRPFLIEAPTERMLTYGECYDIAGALAVEIRARGVGCGERVALALPNSAEFALLYLACLYAGAVVVPIYTMLHPTEIASIVRQAGAKLLIHSTGTQELVEPVAEENGMAAWCLPVASESEGPGSGDRGWWRTLRRDAESAGPPADLPADHLFSITFTSGTTSRPKGVAHRVTALLENASAFNRAYGVAAEDRFLHVFPMAYMAGFLNTLLCPFMAGASVVVGRPFDAQAALHFWEPVRQYGADTFWLAPTMLAALVRVDRDLVGQEHFRRRAKHVWVGTAPLPLNTREDFEGKYGVPALESYGLSELLLISANTGDAGSVKGSVGHVLREIGIRVVDECGEAVGPEEDGEILIRTPYAMAGYVDDDTGKPDRGTAPEWFPTGDIGHVNAEGFLFITGRKKDLIIRGGVNVSPRRVEEVLLRHEAVSDVAVVGLPHDFYGEEVVAVLRLRAGRTLETERPSLAALCRVHLSASAVPTRFVELAGFPTSITGKVQKGKLREQLVSQGASR